MGMSFTYLQILYKQNHIHIHTYMYICIRKLVYQSQCDKAKKFYVYIIYIEFSFFRILDLYVLNHQYVYIYV